MKDKKERIIYLVNRFMDIASQKEQIRFIGFLEGLIFRLQNKKE